MPKKRKAGETTPVYGTMCAELPVITGEMVGGPKLETKQFQTASLDFFKKQCIRIGHSVEQVLREIVNEGLRMWVLDQDGRLKEIPAMDFLTPDNLLDFLQDQGVVFPLAHSRFFWKHTAPDFKGGWQVEADKAPDKVDMNLSSETQKWRVDSQADPDGITLAEAEGMTDERLGELYKKAELSKAKRAIKALQLSLQDKYKSMGKEAMQKAIWLNQSPSTECTNISAIRQGRELIQQGRQIILSERRLKNNK